MLAKVITRKIVQQIAKEELLSSLREYDAVEEPEVNIANVIDPREAIIIINCYEEIIKTENKKTIGYVAKTGTDLQEVHRHRGLYPKCWIEYIYLLFQNWNVHVFEEAFDPEKFTLSSHYFKNNFKAIKTLCNNNPKLFFLDLKNNN